MRRVKALKRIGDELVARGASETLVRNIVSNRRLPHHEKVFLLSDIYAKLNTEPHQRFARQRRLSDYLRTS